MSEDLTFGLKKADVKDSIKEVFGGVKKETKETVTFKVKSQGVT